MTLPTGCSNPVSETSLPTSPFEDALASNEAECTGGRKAAYNGWCGKSDAVAEWALSPTPVPLNFYATWYIRKNKNAKRKYKVQTILIENPSVRIIFLSV